MTVRQATKQLFERYQSMIITDQLTSQEERALWMCKTAIENIDTWTIDKASRWLGFVQCLMIQERYTCISSERDFSRPLFHEAYRNEGSDIPDTVEFNRK